MPVHPKVLLILFWLAHSMQTDDSALFDLTSTVQKSFVTNGNSFIAWMISSYNWILISYFGFIWWDESFGPTQHFYSSNVLITENNYHSCSRLIFAIDKRRVPFCKYQNNGQITGRSENQKSQCLCICFLLLMSFVESKQQINAINWMLKAIAHQMSVCNQKWIAICDVRNLNSLMTDIREIWNCSLWVRRLSIFNVNFQIVAHQRNTIPSSLHPLCRKQMLSNLTILRSQ